MAKFYRPTAIGTMMEEPAVQTQPLEQPAELPDMSPEPVGEPNQG